MTLKQILAVLWRAKWMILAIVVISTIVAFIVVRQQDVTYRSTTLARASSMITNAAASGELGGLPIDADPSSITSPAVLKPAAEALGESVGALRGAITYVVEPGASTSRISITATGGSPNQSRERADAVAEAYAEYLPTEVARVLEIITQRRATANDRAVAAQAAAADAPGNLIASSQLAAAIATLSGLDATIEGIQNAPVPLTVINPATPGIALGTPPSTVVLIAAVAALIAAIGIALIRDQFDNRLRGDEEIEPLTGLPAIGTLSLDRGLARAKERLPAASRRRTAFSEDLRALRTSLQVVLPRQHAVLVVTSVEPGDGKTFIAANLAVAWARTGRKVVLVAGDLRRPALDDYFPEIEGKRGLVELLAEPESGRRAPSNAAILASLVESEHPNLRLLPPGSEPHDPADLLAGASTAQVFESLRDAADLVIIDSPPAYALTDPSLFAAHADGVLVIASVRRTDRTHLVRTVETLQSNDAPVLGVVANRMRRRLPKSYSPYYVQRSTGRPAPVVALAEPDVEELHDEALEDDFDELATVDTGGTTVVDEDSAARRGVSGRRDLDDPGLVPPRDDRPNRLS